MVHGQRRLVSLGITIVASTLACATVHRSPDTGEASGDSTITESQIARSADTNAWEILKTHARRYRYTEDRSGRPLQITTQRGVSSIVLADADSPLVVIDGARLADVKGLADLPASAIFSIDIMSGIRGTGTQGTNASAGVIYIHTRDASRP